MKILTCTQCGAHINPETLTCDYCGSVYLSGKTDVDTKSKKEKKVKVEEISDESLADFIEKVSISNVKENIAVLTFMGVWLLIAISISITVFRAMFETTSFFGIELIFCLVPLFFVFIGLSSIITITKNIVSSNIRPEIELIRKGNYRAAHDSLEKREAKKHNANFVIANVLIDYYKLGNFAEAREHIIELPQNELALFIRKSGRILDISRKLGVRTPNYSVGIDDDEEIDNQYRGSGYTLTK